MAVINVTPKITVKGPKKPIDPNHMYNDIMKSIKSDSGLRKEIRRIFSMANKRISRIESSGLYSPAVAALKDKFSISKFGNGVGSWEQIKRAYAEAYSFLNQTTSTLSGTRQFNEQIRNSLGVTKEQYDVMSKDVIQKITSVSGGSRFQQLFLYYRGNIDQFEAMMEDAKDQVEQLMLQDKERAEMELEAELRAAAMYAAQYSARVINAGVESIFEGIDWE